MKQPEDTRTAELPALSPDETGNPGSDRSIVARRGAYAGAVKIGSENMRLRAKTGKSQAEFAALANVSERTLRTWETSGDVSTATGLRIVAKLRALGWDYRATERRPVKYRDALTGSTWSGRGQMPVWLRVALAAKGRRLVDFEAAVLR